MYLIFVENIHIILSIFDKVDKVVLLIVIINFRHFLDSIMTKKVVYTFYDSIYVT